MTAQARTLLQAVLKLPAKTRAALAERLLASLDANGPSETLPKPIKLTNTINAVIEAAEKDWQAYKRGEMGGTPTKDFVRALRKKRRKS